MKANRWSNLCGILVVLLLAGGISYAGEMDSDDFSFEVLLLNGQERMEGWLKFSTEGVVYEVEESPEPLHEWNVEQIEKVKLRHARLVEIELPAGDKYKFAPIGEYSFDETFAGFLSETFADAEIDL